MNWVLEKLPQHFFLGLGVLVTLAIIVFISKRSNGRTDPVVVKKAASVVQQSVNLAYGAQQMASPLLALTNANYAMAYLKMARTLASDAELTEATRITLDDLQDDIEREERVAKHKILEMCPQMGGASRLAKSAGFTGQVSMQQLSPQHSNGTFTRLV